ncbi:putative PLP-dependent enzyme possibly involved in cell wall biogenesis [Thermanaerovibrio velox DSM 12556]|uniref:Putative PLP-dependent enzyme possibly involved in cell wall biogenesis n=1 Tax=Thermanaerovibrio velox DSM 12556 TaxID=926567 RepID=H0UPR7_9BACT|nr:DegT/DnrJ/EryC1/StrS aminotransferase family protein [Thermanaerovibrio velox]EHM10626.1 putative PLP-dependent enzyme possibly involved in cell wall biogenesis [Thermanaerovibrio velox DSM 12556]
MRDDFLPFSKPFIGEEEVQAVREVLLSGWITTGPVTAKFEEAFSKLVGARFAAAVSSATAGLQIALMALGVGPGDEVITTPMTFAATVNAIIYNGARPVLVDVEMGTMNIDPKRIREKLSPRTKAVMPVHFAGLPADMDAIKEVAPGIPIVEDAAHAIGASYKGSPIGYGPSPLAVFSFHPAKNITTAEGGMIVTDDPELADSCKVMRQHGMSKGAWNRFAKSGRPDYEIVSPGIKANLTDLQSAIGLEQLKRLEGFQSERHRIAGIYDRELKGVRGIMLPEYPQYPHVHGRHIYWVILKTEELGITREEFMGRLKEMNIGTGVHYKAVHHHKRYEGFGWSDLDLPNASYASSRIVSLPLFPGMTDHDAMDVVNAVKEICG